MDRYRAQAKAVTWEEFRRSGGGGPPPDRGPGPVGKAIRDWALRLINDERQIYDDSEAKTPREYVEAKARSGDLTRLFNSIRNDPDVSGTLKAARTILHYHLGLPRPSP